MLHPSGGLCVTNQGCAQAGEIDGSGIVSGAIPETGRIGAAEPGSPVVDLAAMLRGTEGVGRTATAWTHMRGVARLLPFQADASQKALVAEHPPEFSTHLGVIAPISPASLCSPPASSRFHRFERLTRDELAVKSSRQHQQDVGRQVSQVIIPGLIFAPTSADLPAQDGKRFFGRFAPGIADRKAVPLLFQVSDFGLELVNLTA